MVEGKRVKKMNKRVNESKLGLMVFSSAKDLGEKVNEHLLEMYGFTGDDDSFIIPIKEIFFEDGHSKVVIEETVRGKDMFFITDIGNYSLTYKMHNFWNHTSPNDLMEQLKSGIGACCCHARSINIITPLLFNGRQHRRNAREDLSCARTLHELDQIKGIKSIITCDAHDTGVQQALFNTEFQNYFPSNTILKSVIKDLPAEDLKKLVYIAPDNGANGRRNIYSNTCNIDLNEIKVGSFSKQRDINRVVDGKNPIIAHDYIGDKDLDGYTAFIVDDMISSGGSMFDCIDELNKRNIKKIYIIVTFALFTNGIDKFVEYYKDKKFSGIYTTNLSYIPNEFKECEWLHTCDCSKDIARIIYNIQNDIGLEDLLQSKTEPQQALILKLSSSTK